MTASNLIIPEWPAPPNVRALSTTRQGGASTGVYAGFNLGSHVGDAADQVEANRRQLQATAALPAEPRWLTQVHGTRVVRASPDRPRNPEADAAFSTAAGQVCAVLTADCLPVLLCSRSGDFVAAVHAGWRGLAAGIIEATLAQHSGSLLAWLGPAISRAAFEVGEEVRATFVAADPELKGYFERSSGSRLLADLYGIARHKLRRQQVEVYGGNHCTYTEAERFYSYRRDGKTGRMASLIWIDSAASHGNV